ncbi:MAG TPA: endonuclease III [Gemmatimonadaceae bacterium]|nr:endonuclease III [Gemmatimonadaceae bacterium]
MVPPRPRRSRSGEAAAAGGKRPFRFGVALPRIRRTLETAALADAAMFELADRGYRSVFEQLVACVLSIRTRDEVSLPVAIRLFERARSPAAIAELPERVIDDLIRASTFHEAKARQIREIAQRTRDEFGGALPCDAAVLTSFRGVGPKCAALALGVACGQARVAVDVHVHRVSNRWGVIATRTPEQSMAALEAILPRRYRIEINRLLVPFGKHICTGRLPKCATCPVREMCRQVGVPAHR